MEIQLNDVWTIGSQIGEGGFGKVHDAQSSTTSGVAKFIPKEPGAERELLFEERLAGVRNVVPVLDSGEHGNSWVIVMPKASRSLLEEMDNKGGPLDIQDAIKVMEDVCDALEDLLKNDVVHRDIKPGNILLLNGKWCLADFGISRYAEASTQTNTHKRKLSAPYAAPEQWRLQRATGATDIYALGVVAFEMITGYPPFAGHADLADAHLHAPVPPSNAPGKLHYLIESCLAKAPDARPTPSEFRKLLKLSLTNVVGEGLTALENANQELVRTRIDLSRKQSEAKTKAERRESVAQSAAHFYESLSNEVLDAVSNSAAQGKVSKNNGGGWSLVLNGARLEMSPPKATPYEFGRFDFEVFSAATISVRCPANHRGYSGRTHSLWYGDLHSKAQFQWFETAFIDSVLSRGNQPSVHPYALDPNSISEGAIDGGGMSGHSQLAWPFTPVSIFDLDEFVQRWAGWLAAAFHGKLMQPSTLPERPAHNSWRPNS